VRCILLQHPDVAKHGFQYVDWLFDTEENARSAQAIFRTLRDMPDAPATYVSADVCEVIGQA